MSAQEPPAPCRLLELCAELRNRIYEYTFTDDEGDPEMYITKDNCQAPALLRTCRQIQQEASEMYYYRTEDYPDHEFRIDVIDCDPSVLKAFWQHARHFLTDDDISVIVRGRMSWRNFMRWVKAYYDEGVYPLRRFRGAGLPEWETLSGAFEIADALEGVEWDKIENALRSYRITSSFVVYWEDWED